MIKQFLHYCHGFGWWVILAVFLGSLTIMSGVGLMGASAYLITMAGFHPSIAVLQVAIVGVRFFGISRSAARYLERLVSHSVNLRILERIRIRVYRFLEQNFPDSVSTYPSSSMLSLIIQDIESLENLFVRMFFPVLVSMVVTVITVIFVASFSFELGLIFLSGIILTGFIIPVISAKISLVYGGEIGDSREQYQRGLIHFFQFFQEAKIYQRSETIIRSLKKLQSEISRIQTKQAFYQTIFSSSSFLSVQITVLIGLYVTSKLISQYRLDPILLPVLYLVMVSSFESVNNFSFVAQSYGDVKRASKRLSEFENDSEEDNSIKNFSFESGFNIEMKNVSFKYPHSSKMALQNINLSIREGEKIAIVGKSGSGKTTLLDILAGFHDQYSGSVKINGQELKTINKSSLHNEISYLSADPYIFDTTARQNLKLAAMDADDDLLIDTLKKVKLDKRIENLDDELGEHGEFLSGGEIQRFGLARSLLQNGKCILIDEPTENLDPVLAIDLVYQMLNLFSSNTLIWIMHKFYAMDYFDRIIVLEEGMIIEEGSHEELISRKGSYLNLFSRKFLE